ncbi:Ankyrin repeat-containing protein [Melia azedarach]|uniref:Ankyrin repeat-containing protein n=1 Tax=Melia azedarach TaxID=155640 RepID=A0ACC1Y2X4_MELAZ|nr:Ankyrin repeat-containing protein [Melia azedarach]
MKSFVSHPKVDKLVFDHQNCNVSDIVGTYYISLEQIRLVFRFLGLGGKRRHAVLGGDEKKEEGNAVNYKNKDKKDKRKSQYEKLEKHIKETQESHLVVAALIATVSFAAGITLPGGYINEKGPDQGTSVLVLTRNKAFQAFVILNTIAMVFSSYAIFINLCVSTMKHKPAGYNLWRRSTQFIMPCNGRNGVSFRYGHVCSAISC